MSTALRAGDADDRLAALVRSVRLAIPAHGRRPRRSRHAGTRPLGQEDRRRARLGRSCRRRGRGSPKRPTIVRAEDSVASGCRCSRFGAGRGGADGWQLPRGCSTRPAGHLLPRRRTMAPHHVRCSCSGAPPCRRRSRRTCRRHDGGCPCDRQRRQRPPERECSSTGSACGARYSASQLPARSRQRSSRSFSSRTNRRRRCVVAAFLLGCSRSPVGTFSRLLWGRLIADQEQLRKALTFESALNGSALVLGPLLRACSC